MLWQRRKEHPRLLSLGEQHLWTHDLQVLGFNLQLCFLVSSWNAGSRTARPFSVSGPFGSASNGALSPVDPLTFPWLSCRTTTGFGLRMRLRPPVRPPCTARLRPISGLSFPSALRRRIGNPLQQFGTLPLRRVPYWFYTPFRADCDDDEIPVAAQLRPGFSA